MDKITETIPDDMPEWAEKAMAEGQFFKKSCEIVNDLEDKLKWIYAKEKGSDSITGLDSCDDYRDWLSAIPD